MAGHEASTIVPEGHRVTTTSLSAFPEVVTSVGTARVVHLGVRGDEQGAEVGALFDRVQRELETPAGPVLLCAESRTLSDLFAPSNPKIQRIPALVVWTGRQGCFRRSVELAEGVQHLLRLFHSITNSPQPRAQVLYLTDMNWPNAHSVIARLKGLGGFDGPEEEPCCGSDRSWSRAAARCLETLGLQGVASDVPASL